MKPREEIKTDLLRACMKKAVEDREVAGATLLLTKEGK